MLYYHSKEKYHFTTGTKDKFHITLQIIANLTTFFIYTFVKTWQFFIQLDNLINNLCKNVMLISYLTDMSIKIVLVHLKKSVSNLNIETDLLPAYVLYTKTRSETIQL